MEIRRALRCRGGVDVVDPGSVFPRAPASRAATCSAPARRPAAVVALLEEGHHGVATDLAG